jgi:hypothetical protein
LAIIQNGKKQNEFGRYRLRRHHAAAMPLRVGSSGGGFYDFEII